MKLLKFGYENAKLVGIHTFSLPAGHTCLGAKDCLAYANEKTGTITDGPAIKFRCYSASQECLYPTVRRARWYNLRLLKRRRSIDSLVRVINKSVPQTAEKVRVHVSGDFYSYAYFQAWMEVAQLNPNILFYAYTKALPLWIKYRREYGGVPHNFVLTASYGGKYDKLIRKYRLKNCKVFYNEADAALAKRNIDRDDSLAMNPRVKSFGLLIHGIQPRHVNQLIQIGLRQ